MYSGNNIARHHIRTPLWKYRGVGIAERKIKEHNYITVGAKDSSGNLIYPGTYYASGEQIRNSKIEMSPRGVKVKVVKLVDLKRVD